MQIVHFRHKDRNGAKLLRSMQMRLVGSTLIPLHGNTDYEQWPSEILDAIEAGLPRAWSGAIWHDESKTVYSWILTRYPTLIPE
jgi:hypothetical protein